jgi:glycosyltransferase involved in cell wall biosynthesis
MEKVIKTNIVVCGKYHILNYANKLNSLGCISQLYYSHKLTSTKNYSLSKEWSKNFPLKEYLTQLHGRLLGSLFFEKLLRVYSKLWKNAVLKSWESADITHILTQGEELEIIKLAKKQDSIILCEVVNTHPSNRFEILLRESNYWGIEFNKKELLTREINLIEEVKLSDYILTPSEIVSETYRERGFEQKIIKIPYAGNFNKFSKFSKNSWETGSTLKVISIGQIGLRKGQLRLLDAVKKSNLPIEVTLIGVIDPQIKKLLQTYTEYFTHYQRVPHEQIGELLSAHDVYVTCSLEEGLSLSIGEAMSVGLPVIATKESGASEIIEDNETGLIFDAHDEQALLRNLQLLYKNINLRKKLGNSASIAIKKHHNWDNYALQLCALYKKIINN